MVLKQTVISLKKNYLDAIYKKKRAVLIHKNLSIFTSEIAFAKS